MSELNKLEKERAGILEEMGELGDLRRGSLAVRVRPCGKPNCRCKKPGACGHGPTYSLTYKENGKSRMETIPEHRVDEVQGQLENRKRFEVLCKRFLSVNEELCRLSREGGDREEPASKKNSKRRSKRPSRRKSTKS